jgi:mannose-6-phosphate isomerase-like protein (cupin superfamily)
MSEIFEADLLEWQPVRPEIASGVFGRTFLDDGVKIVLTRLAPGGSFAPHRDPYGHLFYFLAGEGVVRIGEREMHAVSGLVVRVDPGELHSYENTGTGDLMLVSVNVPPR